MELHDRVPVCGEHSWGPILLQGGIPITASFRLSSTAENSSLGCLDLKLMVGLLARTLLTPPTRLLVCVEDIGS